MFFSVTSFVSVQSRLSVLKVAEKSGKTISSKMFDRKKCLQTQKLRNPFYRVLKNKQKVSFWSFDSSIDRMITTFMVQDVFWPCELIFSANRTFVADEILTCQTVKCPENTYLGSTHVIFSVLNGQLKNKWLQTKTVTLTFSANWIVRG